MDSIALKIIIHGLIALAPAPSSDDPNHIMALLLDTPVPFECAREHHPKLSFLVSAEHTAECSMAGCDLIGNRCVCTSSLARKDVSLQFEASSTRPNPTGTTARQQVPDGAEGDTRANNHGIPADGYAAAGDMAYVANLTKPPFNAKLNTEYLAPHPKVSNLFARMAINATKLTACSLSEREDQGDNYVLPMSLKPLHAKGTNIDRSQALAQMVLAEIMVEEGKEVKLYISDFDGSNRKSIVISPGAQGYTIDLSNDVEMLERGDPCDDGIARHFAYFYELAESPPAWSDRLIPHVRFVQGMNVAEADAEACKNLSFDYHDRPICPMGSFLP